jgi:hypothetical protein
MATHMANTAREATLATRSTNEHVDAEAEKADVEALGGYMRTGQHNSLD